ncbi:MAG: hypothetical protein WBP88_12475 [Nitrososphaeraceae archaeon]
MIPEIQRFVTIGLVLLVFSTGTAWGTQAFADNHCDKNVDKKCNHLEKNQKSTHKDPVITINPTSGPSASLVTVTGSGFDPSSPVVISFHGDTRVTVAWPSSGGFNTTFNVPSTSSNGDHIVKASQGSNLVSKTFKVTDIVNAKGTQGSNSSSKTFTDTTSVAPTITLNSTSEPVGASINITGAGFDPSSTVVITFNDTDITTVTTSNNGEFFANFTVPLSSSVGFVQVVATQGSNSASKTFIVTSSLAAINQQNVTTTNLSNVTAIIPSYPNLPEKMILPDIFA